MALVSGVIPPGFDENQGYQRGSNDILERKMTKGKDGAIEVILQSKKLNDNIENIAGYFSYMPILTDKYKHWITCNFTVSKGFAYGEKVKIIPQY